MNAHQTRYSLAKAALAVCIENARATYPEAPETTDEDVWMAHFDAEEDCDEAAGVPEARRKLALAERALIDWGKTLPMAKASGLDFDEAARMLPVREKLVEILARVDA